MVLTLTGGHYSIFLGGILNSRDALPYSLNAFTVYGHELIMLGSKWKLLGAIEAMNELTMFGIATAFLFTALSEIQDRLAGGN